MTHTHTHHHLSPLTSTMSMVQMTCTDVSFGPMVCSFSFFFLFSLLIPATSAWQQCDATWHNNNSHPKSHYWPTPPISVMQHDHDLCSCSPPLTSTVSMAQMTCTDVSFWPMVCSFFLLLSFFVTNLDFLSQQHNTMWHNGNPPAPAISNPLFQPHNAYSTTTTLFKPLQCIFNHHTCFWLPHGFLSLITHVFDHHQPFWLPSTTTPVFLQTPMTCFQIPMTHFWLLHVFLSPITPVFCRKVIVEERYC